MAKRTRLLRKNFGEEEAKSFRDRNLNDTRYICKFFKNYVETYLQLAEDSQSQRSVVVSGQLTSFLRARWGLVKVREDSDRHHALDAVVVAACNGGKFTNGESKAFPADQPMRKPDRQGNLTGPIVRSVKLQINKLTGIPVRGGIAKNDTMLRVDVFTKAGKFALTRSVSQQ